MLTSNYQAEYGRSSGGTINVITKSGSRDFRGGGFFSKRHEDFNANEWLNNRTQRAKPPYRFDYSGYHIGGPIILPKFNEGRIPAADGLAYAPDRDERRGDVADAEHGKRHRGDQKLLHRRSWRGLRLRKPWLHVMIWAAFGKRASF